MVTPTPWGLVLDHGGRTSGRNQYPRARVRGCRCGWRHCGFGAATGSVPDLSGPGRQGVPWYAAVGSSRPRW